MTDCSDLRETARLEPPTAAYVTRVDAGLCIGLCVVYIFILLRFLTWVHRLIRRSEDTVRNIILCAIFTSVGVYVLLGLPARWLRNAILSRNQSTLQAAKRSCDGHKKCAQVCATIVSVLDKSFKQKPPDTALRTLAYVLAGLLVLLTVCVALHARALAANIEDQEGRKSPADRRANTRYDVKIIKKTKDGGGQEEETCVVCLSDLWIRKACQLPCEHRFHVGCINRWLSKAYRPICPLCLVEVRVKPSKSQSQSQPRRVSEELDEVVAAGTPTLSLQIP